MAALVRGITLIAVILVCGFEQNAAYAYTLTQAPSGQKIRWHYGQKFFLAGNSTNQGNLSAESLWKAVIDGLNQWNRATQGMFTFDYWQGTDHKIYETKLSQGGLNSIFYASNSREKTDPNVIGFTQVWFNSETGDMMEADIMLNDRDYVLTDSPLDTSSHRLVNSRPRVYLNNVVTHELGHAIGLSHSSSINSSMLYVEFSEQNKLGCDDWAAAKHLYPSVHNGMGALTGSILSPSNEPIAGAVVTAISISRGIPIASVHTDQKGDFHFGALENGDFSLTVEEYDGTPSSIPPLYRENSAKTVCFQHHYPKNFITLGESNALQKFHVSAGKVTGIGQLRIKCEEVSETNSIFPSTSPDIFVDRGPVNSSKFYTFNAHGPFQITGLGYLLLSAVKVNLSVYDQSGVPVSTESISPLYRSETSGYEVKDSSVRGTAFGTITVKVDISENEASGYPGPAIHPDHSPYFILAFNSHYRPEASSAIPNNFRCNSEEPYPAYSSPNGSPIRDATTTTTRDAIGFCGNARAASFREGTFDRSKVRELPSLGSLIGWFFPFLAAIACQLFLKRRRSKLKA